MTSDYLQLIPNTESQIQVIPIFSKNNSVFCFTKIMINIEITNKMGIYNKSYYSWATLKLQISLNR
jgi:hypothetical protein